MQFDDGDWFFIAGGPRRDPSRRVIEKLNRLMEKGPMFFDENHQDEQPVGVI